MAKFSIVVVTAAPSGQAAEAGGAFVKVDGREALLKSVELFLNRDNVVQILLAFLPEMAEEAKKKHGAHLSFSGVRVLSAGPRWADQLAAAVEKLSPDATHVIVHDAARPAVPYTDIDALMEAAEKSGVVALTSPVKNPLVEHDEGGNPVAIQPADRFVNLLTPQAFQKDRFVQLAQSKQSASPGEMTLLKGSPLNVRISGPGDATFVKAMINMLPKPKIKAANPFEEAQW